MARKNRRNVASPKSAEPDSAEPTAPEQKEVESESIQKTSWSLEHKLTLWALVVSSLFSLGALIKSEIVSQDLEASRVESAWVVSNSNLYDFKHPWTKMNERLEGGNTRFVGVKRTVYFNKPFQELPNVSATLSLVNVRPIPQLMRELGYQPELESEWVRLEDLHIAADVSAITKESFDLEIYIGLPLEAGDFLADMMSIDRPDDKLVRNMRDNEQLPRYETTLSQDELWMISFYTTVGTVKTTWIASEDVKS